MVQKMKQRTINKNVAGIYDLTAMQSGMIYHKLLDEASSEYFLQQSFQLNGTIDEEQLTAGIQLLNRKYESLRTIFLYRKTAKPRQIVLNEKEQETTVIDLRAYEPKAQEQRLETIKEKDVARGFDLERDSLLRVSFVRLSEKKTVMIWSAHHIILDGWCFSILFKDFIHYYNALLSGKSFEDLKAEAEQEKTTIFSFKEYVDWQKQQDLSLGMDYWKETLTDYSEVAEIRPMYTGDSTDPQQVRTEKITLDEKICQELHQATLSMQITMSSLMETAWGITLQKYNWTDDVVFGKIVSGRNAPLKGIEEAVGLFINTIPVRVDARNQKTPAQLLQTMQQQATTSSNFDYFSLADVQQQSELGSDLFKTLLMYENYFDADSFKETMTDIDVVPDSMREQTNYPLAMKVYHSADTHSLSLEALYNPRMYGSEEMKQLLETFKMILIETALRPGQEITHMSYLTEPEKQKVLYTFNETEKPWKKGKTMVELFESEVEKTPEKVAVIFKDEQVTYHELNQRANQLAVELRELGIQPDDRVALFTARSVELLVAMLGVIKAGGAYVPIDPTFPEERIQYMMEDSEAKAVLTAHRDFPLETALPIIDVAANKEKYAVDISNLPTVNKPTDLFCCLYTSGTTGKPKGVMLEHRNIVNYCTGKMAFGDSFLSHPNPTFVSVTTYCFDIFIKESFLPLLNQIKIVLADEEEQESQYLLAQLIEKHQANLLVTTPSKMKMFMMDEANCDYMRHLTTIILGGEVFPGTLYEQMRENTDARIFNMCGPTEATVLIVTHEVTDSGYIPLGKPVPNNQIYVMNEDVLCGVGIPGELCISGENLGRGYMKRPELTAEKFVPNPFGSGQLYHAGDLVRWLPNGDLEYLGRIDEQVKIRGFRVELGEIESVLRKQEAISNAAVIVKNDRNGDRAIHAYVVSDQAIDLQHMRDILREELPEFMIPPYMMQIEHIPVTATGKVNRRELPEIQTNSDEKVRVAPVNELQHIIADIFAEVLNTEEVSITDNFFEIGGHSLRATQVINKLEAATAVRLPLRMLFSAPTVEQLSEIVQEQKQQTAYQPIPKAEELDYYPMSSAQRRIYVMNELNDLGVAYNLPAAIRFEGALDILKMKTTFEKIVQRHEILRTSFHTIEGEAVQKIHEQADVTFTHETSHSLEELSHLFNLFVQPFDLSQAPLMRIKLLTFSENTHVLFFDIHHIIADAISISQLFEEFSSLYADSTLELPAQTASYKDYSQWFAAKDLQEQKKFWTEHFNDELPVLDLPLDHPRPLQPTYRGAMLKKILVPELKQGVMELAQKYGATEYMVLLSVCMLLLHKHSRQEDIIVGTSISGRTHKDTEKILGMFVNTLAMRGKPTPEKSFDTFLREIKDESLKAYEHQEYPFEEVVEDLSLARDFSRNPLFDVMFVLQNNEAANFNLQDITVEELTLNHPAAKFDLTFNLIEKNEGYELSVEYATDLFNEDSVHYMIAHYEQLLHEVVHQAQRPIRSLQAAPLGEQQLVLQEFNNTETPSEKGKTMVELFEAQAAQTPDKVAVVFKDQQVTYHELNQRANCLAWYLRSIGVKPDDRVALFTARSVELLVAMLGVIKAGGAYVPIDPSYPEERIHYMLEDSEAKAVLTAHRELPLDVDIPVIEVTAPHADKELPELGNLPTVNTPTDLFCCLYTSGTTGKPKGVMLEHRNIVNYCTGKMAFGDSFLSHPNPTFVSVTTYCFDIFIKESFLPLLNQIKIVLADEEEQESQQLLAQLVEKHQANLLVTTPSKMKMFMMDETNCTFMRHFTTIILGGEVFPGSLYEQMRRHTDARIFNMCGPTEATVLIVTHEVTDSSYIPLGKPVPNNQIYVVDQGELCGVGMPGELCIAGENLGRGYMKRPELTAEKFVPNPYGPGQLYHAGDLVRWLPNGDLEYLGRIDEQVKIRGLRVELGEIESVLRRQPDINNAAVIVKPDHTEEPAIHAYLVSQTALDLSALREVLRQELPDFMVPPYMMQLEEIPVTSTGKVDKRRLPQIEISTERDYVSPSNEIEHSLVSVFEEVLAVSPIGITDSFFELGGDSIKAIRAVSKMREKGYEVSVKDIMQLYTIQSIALRIGTAAVVTYEQGEVNGAAALTPVQKHFFNTGYKHPEHFNQSLMLKSAERLDKGFLKKAINQVVRQHDQLRGVYQERQQTILSTEESAQSEFQFVDWQQETSVEEKIIDGNNRIQSSMSLEKGPLVKAILYRLSDADHLFICVHHLVIDAVSWQIILEDLAVSYQQLVQGQAIALPEKTASFNQWAVTLEEYAQNRELKNEVHFWQGISDEINEAGTETEQTTEGNSTYKEASLALDQKVTDILLYQAGKAYGTEITELLLSGLSRAAAQLLGKEKISIQLESHGREKLQDFPAIDRTVGWFTSLYPFVLTDYPELTETIVQTKEAVRKIPNNGLGYGVIKYNSQYELPNIRTEVAFNYLGNNSQAANDFFQPSSYSTGTNIAENNKMEQPLTINCSIISKQLQAAIIYDADKYSEKAINDFCENFKKQLQELATHCFAQKEPVLTASDFSLNIPVEEFNQLQQQLPLEEAEAIYPLSPMQSGILYHRLKNNRSGEYFMQQILRLTVAADTELLLESFRLLQYKYPVLRTKILFKDLITPVQAVMRTMELETAVVDLTQSVELQEIDTIEADVERGFDFDKDSLVRLTIQRTESETLLIWSAHHIILDGWCFPILFKDFMENYQKLAEGMSSKAIAEKARAEETQLPDYQQYIQWQQAQDKEEALGYWQELLVDYSETAELVPMLGEREATDEQVADAHTQLTEEESRGLVELSVKNQLTMSSILETAWGLTLHQLNHTKDAVFGKVVSGRNAPLTDIEKAVGLFINTIPVRVTNEKDQSIIELLKGIQQQSIDSSSFDYLPLAEVQQQSSLGSELFKTLFIFENYYIDENVRKSVEQGTAFETKAVREQTNYPITVKAFMNEQLTIEILYDPTIYKSEEIQLLLKRMKQLVQVIINHPEQQLSQVNLLDEEEKQLVMVDFNNTEIPYAKGKTVVELFEAEVEKTPQKTALIFRGEEVSYQTLNQQANQLAVKLRQMGLQPDDRIALFTARSVELLVAMLGVIKAGGAYVPIDPSYPEDRIQYMLEDSQPKAVLTAHTTLPITTGIPVIDLYKNSELTQLPDVNLPTVNKPTDLFCCLYTSGTTGKPKGAMLEHRNIVNYCTGKMAFGDSMMSRPEPTFVSVTTYCFDVFIKESFLPLLNQMKIVLADEEQQENQALLAELMEESQANLMVTTPSKMKMFMMDEENCSYMRHLTTIVLGGEVFPGSLYEQMRRHTNARIFNMCGPTEATVLIVTHEVTDSSYIPLGKPVPNNQIYVMNEGRLCGVGMPGELCITGENLGRGYMNRPELTAEKFVPNPFGSGQLYHAGDLVRWLPNGVLEYMGRIDDQVKIRGQRVELGEIESVLRKQKQIQNAAVVVKPDHTGESAIHAYMVSQEELNLSQLREAVRAELPDYMVPPYMMQLTSIPVTATGKVDKRSLPQIELKTDRQYEAPVGDNEKMLAEMFEKVLGLAQVGRTDDFFELGGDSIKAISILSLLTKKQIKLSVRDIFQYRTVKELGSKITSSQQETVQVVSSNNDVEELNANTAKSIDEQLEHAQKEIEQYSNEILSAKAVGTVPLSASQKALHTMEVMGSFGRIQVARPWRKQEFLAIWNALLQEQEMLRTQINLEQQTMTRFDKKSVETIPFIDLSVYNQRNRADYLKKVEAQIECYSKPEYPLHKNLTHHLVVVKMDEQQYEVLLPVSHLTFDGFSSEVLNARFYELLAMEQPKPAEIACYESYTQLLAQGPTAASESELVEALGLSVFDQALTSYQTEKAATDYTSITYHHEMNDYDLAEDEGFMLAEHLYLTALKHTFPEIDIPLLMIQIGRSYGNEQFTEQIGSYIDLLPLTVKKDQNQTLTETSRKSLDYMSKYHVHLLSLMENPALQQSYPRAADIVQRIDLTDLPTQIVNFLMMFDQENSLFDERQLLASDEVVGNANSSKVANILHTKERIILTNLECKRGLEDELIEALNYELEQFVRSMKKK
ncbi:non-ribosomal peptide synthetase [Enterococcus sp. BWR-S5]|uniref:non-ribosomal peptide synthetase n=1 Tax=Enterococcus sp. BWR-S5 TaxID=2787714 RepID=UPI001921CAFC|nr:non-ribosomal peptide synthetase [Enterococcus sp. BWR-S5]MBL1224602.1 amino acid adenylation domain-containing protein [Enterococcus sp. BWR-S5]